MTAPAPGTVYLVGAGPGDPRLITVRGRECLERADAVVYDRLASPRLLHYIRQDAELYYVGKTPERNTLEQEEINRLLVDLALQGKTVTRLKGGDPSVFARVGDEAALLAEHGVPYEIVPGITSAIAVPVYAGIPVTHKEVASSFHVISAHEDPRDPACSVDWASLAKLKHATLVVLMGVKRIGALAETLIEHGRSPETPVALIRWGTRVEQETLTGTLGNIAERVAEALFQNPAIIVIGEVVKMREKLKWFEAKPLFGQRVVVTRARSQASDLSRLIEELGGEPYEFPVIRTTWPDDLAPLDEALARVGEFDWVVFTSVNGVEMFWERMRHTKTDVRALGRAKLAAVGSKTAAALEQRGFYPDAVAEEFVAEGLLDVLGDRVEAGQKILLPRANIARRMLPNALRERGCDVVEVDAYQTVPVTENALELVELLQEGAVHAVTFTSGSTVKNLFRALEGHDVPALLSGVTTAAIGPVTAQTAEERGLKVDVTADTYTIPGLVEALAAHAAKTRDS